MGQAIPVPTGASTNAATILVNNGVILYGILMYLLTDWGPQLESKLFIVVIVCLNFRILTNIAYHPKNKAKQSASATLTCPDSNNIWVNIRATGSSTWNHWRNHTMPVCTSTWVLYGSDWYRLVSHQAVWQRIPPSWSRMTWRNGHTRCYLEIDNIYKFEFLARKGTTDLQLLRPTRIEK